ncbi:MAG: tRNA 2-thiouridine(34) synthase MnmA [Arcobacteraceae bacterium]|nr:tRNA 2-thiouridine(34) synthase MnmA [Arcobacteraceae bacterium]
MNNKKIMVGLSGGVDSSVTAYLLQKEGYEVQGVYMKLHNVIEGYHEKNLEAIDKVAKFLNIKYDIIDLTQKFKKEVYDYFVNGYIDGITPNPCVICNRDIKFGAMFDFAMEKGCDYLATGHYANTDGKFIYAASDKTKDQSYFLGQINKKVLPSLIFPMSKYTKEEIRKIALDIPQFKAIGEKKDSQEICFVEGVYTDILKLHTNIEQKGDVKDEEGNVVGHHKGYMHYTIGKRRGFYVHGAHDPHFVKSIDAKSNTITVCKKENLAINKVEINNLNMFIDSKEFECRVKLRFRSYPALCKVVISEDEKIATIDLYEPVLGVANGQIAVFYDEDKVLGSGEIISSAK